MSQFICPLCGKFVSVRHYDPSNFEDDILLVQVRGMGRGKGVEVTKKYSLLDGSDPELLELISDRVAVIYDMLYKDAEDDEEEDDVVLEDEEDLESLSTLDKEIRLFEREEEEDDEEDEDINDLDEEVIE